MDEIFERNGITFVWNRTKAGGNVEKHGVTFQQAASVFFDPFLRVVDASPKEEVRDAIIGMDENWDLLFVVHIIVEGDQIRIVSARKATRSERRNYEN
jgi:uncharacterized DUF497 family protein